MENGEPSANGLLAEFGSVGFSNISASAHMIK